MASGGTGAAHTRLAPYLLPEHQDMVVEKIAASAFSAYLPVAWHFEEEGYKHRAGCGNRYQCVL